MNKKYKVTLLSIFILLILTIGISISYAVKKDKKNIDLNASIVYTDEFLSINYLDGKSFDIKNLKAGDTYSKKVSITNVYSENLYVTLGFMDVEKSSDSLELTIYDGENNIIYDKAITNVDTEVIKSVSLPINKTVSYTLMVKNNGADAGYFSANLLAYKDSAKQSSNTSADNFKESILANNEIKSPKTNVGNEAALENEGLIKTNDNDGESYYFRGAVDNNYVNFANFSWRIVRINGNDSVRLILDSTIDTQLALNDDSSETDDYSTKLLFDNLKIKNELNTWLNTNLSEFSKYIMESSFCEDVSVFNQENNTSYLNAYNRIFVDRVPSLTCMGTNIKSKIGILTADEVAYAGAFGRVSNSKYYLYNPKIPGAWWTLSGSQIIPNYNIVDAISVNRDGSLSYDKKISSAMFIRPVISLDVNTSVTGSGTQSDPYVVKVS